MEHDGKLVVVGVYSPLSDHVGFHRRWKRGKTKGKKQREERKRKAIGKRSKRSKWRSRRKINMKKPRYARDKKREKRRREGGT